jgi:hypothetical protein
MTAASPNLVRYGVQPSFWRRAAGLAKRITQTVSMVVALLLASGSTVRAEEACPPDLQNQSQIDNKLMPSAVVWRLEAAWNTDDRSAALALFADDAVARSNSLTRCGIRTTRQGSAASQPRVCV